MAIKDFSSNVTDEQRQQAYNRMNPPEYEPGFEPQGNGSANDFDELSNDLFGGSSDLFAGGDGDMFSSGGSNMLDGGGGDPFSSSSGLGGGWGDMSSINSGGTTQPQQPEKDNMDKAIDYSAESIVSMGHILIDLVKSMANRSCDDWALISNKCIIIGSVVSGLAIVLTIVGIFSGFGPLRFVNAPATCLTWGLLTVSCGLAGLSSMVLLKIKNGDFTDEVQGISELPDATDMAASFGNEFDNSYDSSALDDLDETVEGLLDGILNTNNYVESEGDTPEVVDKPIVRDPEDIIKNITNAPMLTRKYLFDTLSPMFPENTPDFGETTVVEPNTDEYLSIVACLQAAIASACNKQEDEINLNVKSIESNLFSYNITFERDQSFRKTSVDTLRSEIVNYFKSEADDGDVSVRLKTLAGDYICVISKGEKVVITMGDCFKRPEVSKYYYNENNKLPFIVGIDELGKVYMADAKDFPSLMIVGMSRSGKSWYVNSFLLSLAAFNDPSTVQFLVIDPKESVLFKTIGLLPHCCGVHNHSNIIAILRDVLNVEADRRKKLLADHRCDTIWSLREKKNIQVPFLYVVIDEVMTVIKSLEADGMDKEFLDLLIQIITQLPSLGIGVLIVPHRAQGVVDKTTRSQMHFRAAVRASTEVIKETLDVSKWDRPLVAPGDIALRSSSLRDVVYVKGTGVTLSDEDNVQLIANLARAYYKMGVDDEDMSTIGCGYNRDLDHIKEELNLTIKGRVQFDLDEDI